MYLSKEPSMLEAVASSTLFSVKNVLVFAMNTSWKSEFFRCRKAHCVTKRPIQLSWRNTCISQKKTNCVRSRASGTLFPCEKWVSFWKEYLLQLRLLKEEIGSLFPVHLFSWVEKTCVSPERKSSVLEAGASITKFPCENCVNFERTNSYNLGFWTWK
jgi:hypothetical protein